MRKPQILAAWLLVGSTAASTFSAEESGNAVVLLDRFLVREAAAVPQYRTDIQQGGTPETVGLGRILSMAPFLGPFSYRPIRYSELSAENRSALLRNPKLRNFLTHPDSRGGPERIEITPEEMTKPGPLVIDMPPP